MQCINADEITTDYANEANKLERHKKHVQDLNADHMFKQNLGSGEINNTNSTNK